jgi:mitochondrial fission protein ELM1
MSPSPSTIWALALPEAGFRSQVIGLAEALRQPFMLKNVNLKKPWSLMPVRFCPFALLGLTAESDALTPPWPDLVISCGRRTVPLALAIKSASGGKTRAVHIQDPKSATPLFDLVIPMMHDGAKGPNVMHVDTALHRITEEKLREAASYWTPSFSALQRPLVGVILGGSNRTNRFTKYVAERMIALLDQLHHSTGAHIYIVASRRTDDEALQIFDRFSKTASHIRFWKGEGENPYLGILALSDALIVTEDSVSMISEALSTGKPVATVPLAGVSKRHGLFIENLRSQGAITRFEGTMPKPASVQIPNATTLAANAVRELMGLTE